MDGLSTAGRGRRARPLLAGAAVAIAIGVALVAMRPGAPAAQPSAPAPPATAPSIGPSRTAPPSPSPSAAPTVANGGWTEVPSSQFGGISLAVVAHSGAEFVGIGSPFATVFPGRTWPHPTIWRSSDGLSWERLPDSPAFAALPSDHDQLVDVVLAATPFGPGLVAVGMRQAADGSDAAAAAWTSSDGRSWNRGSVDGAAGSTMDAVVSTDRGLVAIGTDGYSFHAGMSTGTAVWTSLDGMHWARVAASAAPPRGVALGTPVHVSGRWYVPAHHTNPLGPNGDGAILLEPPASVWTSDDAVHWTPLRTQPWGDTVASLAWDGQHLVAVGTREGAPPASPTPLAWTSDDGRAWREFRLPMPPGSSGGARGIGIVATPAGFTAIAAVDRDGGGVAAWAWPGSPASPATEWTPFANTGTFRDVTAPIVQAGAGDVFVAGRTGVEPSEPRLLVLSPNGAFLSLDEAMERARTVGRVAPDWRLSTASLLRNGDRDPSAPLVTVSAWTWVLRFIAEDHGQGVDVLVDARDGHLVRELPWIT